MSEIEFCFCTTKDFDKKYPQHTFSPSLPKCRTPTFATRPLFDPQQEGDDDLKTLREGIKLSRRLHAESAFDEYRGEELYPGPEMQTDAQASIPQPLPPLTPH